MDSNRSGRRRFLEQGAALAGLAVGAGLPASAQEGASAAREVKPKGPYPYGERSRFVTAGRTNDYSKNTFSRDVRPASEHTASGCYGKHHTGRAPLRAQ